MQGLIPKVQLLLCWIYICKGKSTKGNCFQVPCFHFGRLCSCQLIMGTRLEQTQLYGIIKLSTGSLKMSTRESLLCKKQPIKSQRSLWISSLPERSVLIRFHCLLQRGCLMEEVGGRFPLSRECSTATIIAETALLLSPPDSTFPMCEWQECLGVRERRRKNKGQLCLPDTRKYCSSVALIAPSTGQLQIMNCSWLPKTLNSSQYLALLWCTFAEIVTQTSSNSFSVV